MRASLYLFSNINFNSVSALRISILLSSSLRNLIIFFKIEPSLGINNNIILRMNISMSKNTESFAIKKVLQPENKYFPQLIGIYVLGDKYLNFLIKLFCILQLQKLCGYLNQLLNPRGESFSKFLLLVTNKISGISLWRIICICKSSI